MSKLEKLFDKIKNNPHNVRFNEICKLAEAFGFKYKGGKGSHVVYSKRDIIEIVDFQNVNGMAKPYQIRQFLKIIEEYGLKLKGG
jgi:predicted RNA binding protein YcfA (HicA-like mRNA interferase family)